MGVAPVDGYGNITKNNAADIYRDKATYNKLDPAQQAAVKHYLTQDEIEYIDSNTKGAGSNAYQDGKNKLGDDVKNAEESKNQDGNVAGTSIAGLIFAAGAAIFAKLCPKMSKTNAWTALGFSVASLACSIGALVCAKKFDDVYDNRCKANDNAGTTNGTIDTTKSNLEATYDSMNEDMDTYSQQQADMTDMVNANVSEKADLQVQLLDAMAAGDTEGAKELQDQIKALDETDYSQQEDELNETREHMEEYQQCNDNALGVADGGTIVSDFLKIGTPYGIVATVNAVLLAVAGIFTSVSVASAAGSFKTLWEVPVALAAAALFAVSVAMLGTATNTMREKATKEFDCGSSGKDMRGSHVDPLYQTIEKHKGYMQFTKEGFTKVDDEEGKTREDAEQSAADTVADAKKRVNSGGGGGEEEEEEKPKDEEK